MESRGSDDDRQQQQGEAAFAKKMKILVIMLSLVLMILLIPLASDLGLPLLKPIGVSMLQRLWDAMRFIAMTAAISIGIISTSNSNKNNKNNDSSSHYRSTSSFHRPSKSSIASSSSNSREIYNSIMSKSSNRNRSGLLDRESSNRIWGEDKGVNHQRRGLQSIKGKEAMNNFPSTPSAYSETYFDSNEPMAQCQDIPPEFVQSERESIEAQGYDGIRDRPVKLSMVNPSKRQWSAGDAWFFASTIDEEVEEGTVPSAQYEVLPNRFHAESNVSRVSLQKDAPANEKDGTKMKGPEKGLANVYNSLTDDNYTELRMRKSALSRLAEESSEGKGKAQRRSNSVDRRRPAYIYDRPSPDQPGLKQILMEMSKDRPVKSKMSDLGSTSYQAYDVKQRGLGRSNNASASVHESLNANVQHRHTSVVSTVKMPSNLGTASMHADAETMGATQTLLLKKGEATKMDFSPDLLKDAGVSTIGSASVDQSWQANKQKRANDRLGNIENLPLKQANQSKMSSSLSTQKQVNGNKEVTQQNVNKRGDSKLYVASKVDVMKSTDSTPGYNKLGAEAAKHARGPGEDHGNISKKASTLLSSRLLKQSSKHSHSALNLAQLEQEGSSASQNTRLPAGPSARGRRSFSYDFGDGFNPDWLMELEPPPPPILLADNGNMLGSSSTEAAVESRSNTEGKEPGASSLVKSLVPWRSSAPIDISAFPRAASPPEILSQISGPSPGELKRQADEFISKFTTRLIKQRRESLERQRRYFE